MRKNSLRSVFIAVLFSLSIIMFGMVFGTFHTVKAEYVADLFTVEASAETRTSEPYGLRFTIRLGANEKASIASGEKTLGAMIVPYFYVEDYESYKAANPSYTGGYYEYFSNVKKKMIHFTYDNDVIYADAEHNCYRVKISILNVKYENLNLDFVAIGYLRTGEGTSPSDYEYTKVGSAYARSIAYVAGQAVGDLDGEAKTSLQEIVTLAELQKKGVTKSGNTYTYNDTDYTLSEISDEIFDFIKNGSTSYRLVIPNDVTGAAANGTHKIFTTARQELKNLLAAATGINILEWTDEQATSNAGAYNGSQKYISLGKTEVLTAAGVTYDALDETGYALKIKNGSL
ncbi:MAG: hypothetical protein J5911_04180, partial [Clostridia bacterium]|nr:hypothetical protein [Clostridia bacterium]